MHGKQLLDFLFHLYDYADDLAERIQPGNPDNANYFLTMVFIESYFDRLGRGEIRQAAEAANMPDIDPSKSLAEAHRRIDALRSRITQLSREYDFDEVLQRGGQQLATDWIKPKP